jgi:hypothetical protein
LGVAELGASSQNYPKTTLAKCISGFAKTHKKLWYIETEVFNAQALQN